MRTVLDTLDSDQELFDAQVALVATQRNEIRAEFSLLSVLGYLSPENLDFSGVELDCAPQLTVLERKILNMDVDRVGDER